MTRSKQLGLTMERILPFALSCVGAFMAAQVALAQPIADHKNRLFNYPAILSAQNGGAYRIVDYREKRDIDRRDEVPERRVRRTYVDSGARRATKAATLETPAGSLTYRFAGSLRDARFITVYIHGSGGNSKQGVDDFSFGGNFNRLKALKMKSGGVYIAPDAGTFSDEDMARLRAMFSALATASPSARIVVACGSSGGLVCYQLARDNDLVTRLAGIVLLGSYGDTSYLTSVAGRARVPIVIAHGSGDSVFPVAELEKFYATVRNAGVPVQMVRFETGTHGTPIRMIDWRETLNWLLTN